MILIYYNILLLQLIILILSKYYILSLEFIYYEKSDFIEKFCLHRGYNELHIGKIFFNG